MIDLGNRQSDNGKHFGSTKENHLLRFDHDQVGALGRPLNLFVRDILQTYQLLLRLLASHCESRVEVVDDDVFA